MAKQFKPETLCVQAGWTPKKGEPRVLPIYQSTTFKYDTSEQMARLFDLEDSGYFYTRLQNSWDRRDLDDITGFVLKDDILICMSKGNCEGSLLRLRRDILRVPETLTLSDQLEIFLEKRQQIAVVVDEYGGTRGLVTLEDVVETLFGMEIMDEMDKVADMQVLARQQWKKRSESMGFTEPENTDTLPGDGRS